MTRENIIALRIRKQPITNDLITFECTIEDYTHFTLYVSKDLQKLFGKINGNEHSPDIYFSVTLAQLTRLSRKHFTKEDRERYNILHKEYVRKRTNRYYKTIWNIENADKRKAYTKKWYMNNIDYMKEWHKSYYNSKKNNQAK